MYYFDPAGIKLEKEDGAIVETARGIEYGTVIKGNSFVPEEAIVPPLKQVMRRATEEDTKSVEQNHKKETEAFGICLENISRLGLDMKLVYVEMTFDRNKLIFYFTSDGRIELRQIGVRDEAKMLNGIGICGRPLCCASFLGDFQPVSIKMAKEQNLSLNPTKISGICGRLMCCLKYEEDVYEELNKKLPRVGDIISTPDGTGEILTTNVLMQQVKAAVRKAENDPPTIGFYHVDEIKLIRSKKKRKQNPEGEKHHEE